MNKKISQKRYFSKKTGEEVKIIDPDFDIFFEKFSRKDPVTGSIFQRAVEVMGILLIHHPFFIEQKEQIRDEFNLPKNGLPVIDHLAWFSEDKEREEKFKKEVNKLSSKFKIPSEIKKSTIIFIEDNILFDKKRFSSPYKTELQLMTKGQIEEDLDSCEKLYLPITPMTSISEIKTFLGMLQKKIIQKDIQNYGLPTIDPLGVKVWQMYLDDYSTKDIKEKIRDKYRERNGSNPSDEDIHRLKSRFKAALNKIYPRK